MARRKLPSEGEVKRVILKPYSFDRYELVEDYIYIHKGQKITVPKGYITNGADIPRIFWSIFPPNKPEYISAVVVHDYLCDDAMESKSLSKYMFADEVFYSMLRVLNISKVKSKLFYWNCKLFHKFKGLTHLWKL